jgi:hypothetical protein
MAECEKLNVCPFFRDELSYLPRTAEHMKQVYCHGDKTRCARYMVAAHGIEAARDLYPNQMDQAYRILRRPGWLPPLDESSVD